MLFARMKIIETNLSGHLVLCYLSLKSWRFLLDGGVKTHFHIYELDFHKYLPLGSQIVLLCYIYIYIFLKLESQIHT